MHTKTASALRSALLLAAGLACAGPGQGAEYWLRTGATSVAGVPMWGYALCGTGSTAPATCAGQVTVPGPVLAVAPGEDLVVHLTNTLPEPTSLVIAGQVKREGMQPVWFEPANAATTYTGARPAGNTSARVRSFDREAAPGGTVTYTWAGLKPGTYLYRSGTHPQVQVQMGLYGAVAKDAGPGQVAYTQGTTSVTYRNQVVLLYSEVDPDLHAAVANGTYGTSGGLTSTLGYHPRFFLINGKSWPDASLDPLLPAPLPAGQDLLLRFVNAGLLTHVPTLYGQHWRVVAEDGNPVPVLANPRQQYSAFLAPGKTLDVLLTPDNPNAAGNVRYTIADSRYYDTAGGAAGGGMFARIEVGPAVAAAPLFDTAPPTTGQAGTAWQYQAHATASGGHSVQYALPTGPAVMVVDPASGLVTWPAASVTAGTWAVTVRATDTVATLSADQSFNVTIAAPAANSQPVARADTYTAVLHAASFGNQALAAPGVLANDSDADGTALTAGKTGECVLDSGGNCGASSNRITLNPDGSLSLASSATAGNLRMTYRASDGSGAANQFSLDATVTINMIANRAPVAVGDSFTVPRCTVRQSGTTCRTNGAGSYQPPTLDLVANDTDADAATLDSANQLPLAVARTRTGTIGGGSTNATLTTLNGGRVTVSGGTITYVPPYNFTGTDTFSYRVKDRLGKESGSLTGNTDNLAAGWATVTINVN